MLLADVDGAPGAVNMAKQHSSLVMNKQELAALYEKLCQTPSDINEHLSTFVQMVKSIGATRVIELGVREGVSTVAWLYALHDEGHLWSVDVSFPAEQAPIRSGTSPIVDSSKWTFILGRDDDPFVLATLPTECDIVFIDTAHTFEQTYRELELYKPRVRSGGYILLHDTLDVGPQPWPVRHAIEKFVGERDLTWDEHAYNHGLGVIQIISLATPQSVKAPEVIQRPIHRTH